MIRRARLTDIPALVELGMRFMHESGYAAHLTANPNAHAELAERLITDVSGLVLVDERESEIVGMLGAIATVHPHSGDRVMAELFWYVAPDARGSGVRLLQEAEHWAITNGVRKSIVVAPEGSSVDLLYVRMGYKPLERQFIKDLL